MAKIEAVIFDWAGTTVDFGSTSPVSAFMEAFRRAGIEVTDEETRAPMGMLKRDHIFTMLQMPRIKAAWVEKYGNEPTRNDMERIYQDFEPALMAVLDRHCDLKPGLLETVEYLRNKDIQIGSTTGFTEIMMKVVTSEAAKAGYSPDTYVTAEDVNGYGRPWPFMVFENMRRLQLKDVRRIIKVGDTTSDIQEGKNAGLITVGVVEGSSMMGLDRKGWDALSTFEKETLREQTRYKFMQAGADATINSLEELPALIETLGIH